MSRGWIGVDLDGTLAKYDRWNEGKIGEPIMPMVQRVKQWIRDGYEVRVMTARWTNEAERADLKKRMDEWLLKVDIPPLAITNVKDYQMLELWDDRAVRVEKNTGRRIL